MYYPLLPFLRNKTVVFVLFLTCLFIIPLSTIGQTDTTIYHLTVKQEMVNKTGREITGMTLNGSIAVPVLQFTEGDYAVIIPGLDSVVGQILTNFSYHPDLAVSVKDNQIR